MQKWCTCFIWCGQCWIVKQHDSSSKPVEAFKHWILSNFHVWITSVEFLSTVCFVTLRTRGSKYGEN